MLYILNAQFNLSKKKRLAHTLCGDSLKCVRICLSYSARFVCPKMWEKKTRKETASHTFKQSKQSKTKWIHIKCITHNHNHHQPQAQRTVYTHTITPHTWGAATSLSRRRMDGWLAGWLTGWVCVRVCFYIFFSSVSFLMYSTALCSRYISFLSIRKWVDGWLWNILKTLYFSLLPSRSIFSFFFVVVVFFNNNVCMCIGRTKREKKIAFETWFIKIECTQYFLERSFFSFVCPFRSFISFQLLRCIHSDRRNEKRINDDVRSKKTSSDIFWVRSNRRKMCINSDFNELI